MKTRKGKQGSVRTEAEVTPRQVRTILVPVDFSEPSKNALRYARQFAEPLGASISLIHVLEPLWYPHDWDYLPLIERKGAKAGWLGDVEREKEARKRLSALAEGALGNSVPTAQVVKIGTPWNEITLFAKREKMDMIVIGTHGRTGLKHVVMGSTAERVVRHAHCPVLVVR